MKILQLGRKNMQLRVKLDKNKPLKTLILA